jgi:hypothetical protein
MSEAAFGLRLPIRSGVTERIMSTPTALPGKRQATTGDEIKPLLELCRAGKLFEVQE